MRPCHWLSFALALSFCASNARADAARRELRKRTLVISDATANSIAELHVAGGVPTTLVFQLPVREHGVLLADTSGSFYPAQVSERTLLLVPKRDLQRRRLTTLTVTLEDGTVLPFKLTTAPHQVDLQVDVQVTLERRAAPESAQALKAISTQLRSQLDECKSSSGSAGVSKVAALILAQDSQKPQSFTVQRQGVHRVDKQSRLWVEVTQVYRLFDFTYVVATIQNRDPSKPWVLDRPEIAVRGEGESADVRIAAYTWDASALAPDESARVVIAFATPSRGFSHDLVLSFLEKSGTRHFKLEGLPL